MELRPYQQRALDEIRAHYAAGVKKVLLKLPTGGGKTLIFCQVLKGAAALGNEAILVVSGKDLVAQASDRLEREGVPHGVLQGNHKNVRPDLKIQACSITTLYARRLAPKALLIVIDEAHQAGSNSYHWLVEQYPDAYFLAVSATPHIRSGMRHIAEVIVSPVTVKDLIEQGYLAPPKYFVPSMPDLSHVKIDKHTKDYNNAQLAVAMDNAAIFGDLIKSYRTHGKEAAALAFAVNVEHSKHLVESFVSAGIPAAHVDAGTSANERRQILGDLERGLLKVVSNVGLFTTGVDLPFVECLIIARPTKSYNLHVQIIGRGTRPFPGKKCFVVLDHASNVMTHGTIEEERKVSLDGKAKIEKVSMRRCERCFFVWDYKKNNTFICPDAECGHDNKPAALERAEREAPVQDKEVQLVEISSARELDMLKRIKFIDNAIRRQIASRYKPRWVYYQIKQKYGEETADRIWPAVVGRIPR